MVTDIVRSTFQAIGKDFILMFHFYIIDIILGRSIWEKLTNLARGVGYEAPKIITTGVG